MDPLVQKLTGKLYLQSNSIICDRICPKIQEVCDPLSRFANSQIHSRRVFVIELLQGRLDDCVPRLQPASHSTMHVCILSGKLKRRAAIKELSEREPKAMQHKTQEPDHREEPMAFEG